MFAQAFRTPDLRKKLLFTLGIIVVYRFGASLPAPGISTANVRYCSGLATAHPGAAADLYAMLNLFSGGSLLHITVFALSIMPYITSSIILQLLTEVIPRLRTLKDQGHAGQAKITQYTRYLTVGLAILIAATYVQAARSGSLFSGSGCSAADHPLIPHAGVLTIATMMITMVSGTAVIMWMGELITDRGIGNGMSLLIFTSIAARFPQSLAAIHTSSGRWDTLILVILIGFLVIGLVVFVEQSQRRVPVQYAKRMIGRKMYGGTSTYIPLKVNMAGVIPVIFASSLLALPAVLAQFNQGRGKPPAWVNFINSYLVRGDHPIYMICYVALIIFFTFFYVSITFNPVEVADNMKKYGGFIPGIRAGKPTEDYLSYVLSRITLPGALYLGFIALIPLVAFVLIGADQNFPFGGTSILIMVGVALDTVKQIESQLQQRNYEGFLR